LPPKAHPVPESLRSKLARPLGELLVESDIRRGVLKRTMSETDFIITVGDRVTETIAQLGRVPDVHIIDGRERRKQREAPDVPYSSLFKADNPAGTITDEAVDAVRAAMRSEKPARILVNGEEDLLAIPAIATAPIGANLYYGQPLEGVVVVRVSEQTKERNLALMRQIGI
jgi:uncharacterized protein (UPF0218 family)